jgi:hypothetical protein
MLPRLFERGNFGYCIKIKKLRKQILYKGVTTRAPERKDAQSKNTIGEVSEGKG